MSVLSVVSLTPLLESIKKGLSKSQTLPSAGTVWRLAVFVSDGGDAAVGKSRFYKSIRDEIDDNTKKATFAQLISGIAAASNVEKYRDFFKDSIVECKEAHAFMHNGQRIKILELKRQRKKERLYFYPFVHKDMRFFVLLLALHKRDESTPQTVADYCQQQIAQLLNGAPRITTLEQ